MSRRQSYDADRALDRLARGYVATRDESAREALIAGLLPLVRRLAWRYRGRGEPYDDLVQAGCVGLVKAVDRFDPVRGTSLVAYAVPTIVGEIRRHLRDRGGAVAVPRGLRELAGEVYAAVDAWSSVHGRSPTIREIAAELDRDAEDVVEALAVLDAQRAVPLVPYGDAADDARGASVDTIGACDRGYDAVEDRAAVRQGLRVLDERERQIVALTFFGGHSQARIAYRFGISQMHVSRVLRRALDKAQSAAEASPATRAAV
jgi:RNA polymerase sigma-B factor